MDAQELQHKKELVEIHKERKRILEKQAAKYGLSVDPRIPMELNELAQQIAELEREIVLAEKPRRTTDYSDSATPPPNNHELPFDFVRGRHLQLLLITVAMALLLFYFLPISHPPASSYQDGRLPIFAAATSVSIAEEEPTQKQMAILSVGQAWEKNGISLLLEKVNPLTDVVQVTWIFTNNTENDITLPASLYGSVSASSIDGVQPILSNICSDIGGDFDCTQKARVIKKGQQMSVFDTLRYPGLDFSNSTPSLIIGSGITDEAQWSISSSQ